MSGGIYLLKESGQLIEMKEQAYDSEALLQELLEKYPSLLAGEQIDSDAPRRWLLLSREIAVPSEQDAGGRWAVDHLFLDQDAIPTLVEVKRSSDTRIRREVVGQMLDYAANAVVYWPLERIRARFEERCTTAGEDPNQLLVEALGFHDGCEPFWARVKTNLQAGRVRLVFVADEIPTELKRVVEFLNSQMDPAEVLAVEIRQYVGEGVKSLVPRVVGQTAEAHQRKTGALRAEKQWDERSYFEELSNRKSAGLAAVASKILDWAKSRTDHIWWGKGSRSGSFVPIVTHNSTDHQLFAVYTYGNVELYFQYYQHKAPFESEKKRRELLNKLNAIRGVSIPEDGVTRRPSIPLSVLSNPQVLNQFLAVFEWFIEQVRSSN